MSASPLRALRPVIAPVVLGCCPDEPRCLLCGPPPPSPTADVVAALAAAYRAERATADEPLVVSFYGGSLPSDELLDAIAGEPFLARVRPDLVTRADVQRLVARGAVGIELDALTFDDLVLRAAGRRYTGGLVRQIAEGLREAGLRVGLVLSPGLPGSDHDRCVRDAEIAADLADTVRLLPVLVLEGSRLAQKHRDGVYVPLTVGDAVATCRDMMDVLEAAGVAVIRVGLQPGPDGVGRALAGPRHPSLRELVEATRVLDRLRALLDGTPPGAQIEIRCAPPDETRTRGPLNQHVRTLRAELGLGDLRIAADPALPRGTWEIRRATVG